MVGSFSIGADKNGPRLAIEFGGRGDDEAGLCEHIVTLQITLGNAIGPHNGCQTVGARTN